MGLTSRCRVTVLGTIAVRCAPAHRFFRALVSPGRVTPSVWRSAIPCDRVPTREAAAMGDGPLDRFVAELWRTPVPAAPLRRDRRLEGPGLHLLGPAPNPQHIPGQAEAVNLSRPTPP